MTTYIRLGDSADNVDYSSAASGVMVYTGGGNDYVTGSAFGDSINGAEGNDTIYGGDTKDVLVGGADIDVLYGGLGNDKFIFQSGDLVDAGAHGGQMDQIMDFYGAGGYQAWTGVHDDMIEFYGFGAGSHLDYVSDVGGDPTVQVYAVYGTGGVFEGNLEVHMADGYTGHLVYGDYRFMA